MASLWQKLKTLVAARVHSPFERAAPPPPPPPPAAVSIAAIAFSAEEAAIFARYLADQGIAATVEPLAAGSGVAVATRPEQTAAARAALQAAGLLPSAEGG